MRRTQFSFACRTFFAAVLFFGCVTVAGAQQVAIASPANGSIYAPGATINVTATASGPVLAVKVAAQDIGMSPYQAGVPYAFELTVPTGVIGPRNLFAEGLVATETAVFSPSISVDIESSTPPAAINFQQSLVALGYVGQQQRVGVTGTFADGSTLDVTESTHLTFASSAPSVVSIDATGLMTALAPGTATITALYGNLAATLKTVGPSGIKGDLNGDGFVTVQDLLLLETMVGNTPTGPKDARDLNGDGKINNLDVQALLTLCGAQCPSLTATTTLLKPSATQAQYTQPITFASTVSGSGAPPSGSVSFIVDGQLAEVGILGSADQASVTLNSLSIGNHTVSALYGGDPRNEASASASVSVNIVAVPGDVNGDGAVDCLDLELVKAAFGTKTGQPGFNPAADVNHDGVVNVLDLSYVARLVPAGTTCP